MARTCRFAAHVGICSAIGGDTRSVPLCTKSAKHRSTVVIDCEGVELQLRTDLCVEHHVKMSTAKAFVESEPIVEGVTP